MINDIDDIFKEGLGNSGLEYKEAYWDEIQCTVFHHCSSGDRVFLVHK